MAIERKPVAEPPQPSSIANGTVLKNEGVSELPLMLRPYRKQGIVFLRMSMAKLQRLKAQR